MATYRLNRPLTLVGAAVDGQHAERAVDDIRARL